MTVIGHSVRWRGEISFHGGQAEVCGWESNLVRAIGHEFAKKAMAVYDPTDLVHMARLLM